MLSETLDGTRTSQARFYFNVPYNTMTPQTRNRLAWTIAIVLLAFTAFTRLYRLEDKPFHHDESLHAFYSNNVAKGTPHQYSALLHGPLLYHLVGAFVWAFGPSDWSTRLPAALCGILLIALPLLARRVTGWAVCLAAMALLAFSPSMMYFGRFLREDVFMAVWTLGFMVGVLVFWRTRAAWALYLAAAALAFQFTNKENTYLHAGMWGAGIFALSWFAKRLSPPEHAPQAEELPPPRVERAVWINAGVLFATIYVLLYTSFFRHPGGTILALKNALYKESLFYWWEQNRIRRIDGPFDYHLPLLANYEFVLFPLVILAWVRLLRLATFIKTARRLWSWALPSLLLLVLIAFAPRVSLVSTACDVAEICLPGLNEKSAVTAIAKLLHLTHTRHLLQIVFYAVAGGTAFLCAVSARRRVDAFLWFWLTGAFGVYSYVGEKVPWLVLCISMPMLLISAFELARAFGFPVPLDGAEGVPHAPRWVKLSLSAFLLIAAPFTLYKALRVSLPMAANPRERLVFTQTTPEAKRVRDRLREVSAQLKSRQGPGANLKIQIAYQGEATWPFAWYLHEFPGTSFVDGSKGRMNYETAMKYDAIIMDAADQLKIKQEFQGYNIYTLPLRAWWVPYGNPSWAELFRYFFFGQSYGRKVGQAIEENFGIGDTRVLYLERQGEQSPFSHSSPVTFLSPVP